MTFSEVPGLGGKDERGVRTMTLINREGREAMPEEQAACERRALEILRNPYASPEQIAWAIEIAPVDFEMVFWESSREKAARK